MKKAVIFASYIPTKDTVYIGEEFLNFFEKNYADYDLYVGVNPSCEEWITMLNQRNIKYKITPEEFVVKSDVSAYQSALSLLKESGNEYDLYIFAHTKGVTSNAHTFRTYVFDNFLSKNKEIERLFENDSEMGLFSPWFGICSTKGSIQSSLDTFLGESECKNTDFMVSYTFYAIKGSVINNFIKNVKPIFWDKRITDVEYPYYTHVVVGSHIYWNFNVMGTLKNDIYFFERDFPMIVERYCLKITDKL